MKLKLNKKDVEKLFDDKQFDVINSLLKLAYPPSISNNIIGFITNNEERKSADSLKQYVVNSVLKAIRSYNIDEDIKYFEPYIEKRKFFQKKLKGNLTKEESVYMKVFPKDEKGYKKDIRGYINKDSFDKLKKIYEENKEETYTLIHRTAYDVDPIFEEGIKFGSSSSLYNYCQRMDNFYFMLAAISLCNNYKHSLGCFIMKVPKRAITEKSEPIYYEKDKSLYLNPKYVVAYVPVSGKKILSVEYNDEANEVESKYYEDEHVKGLNTSLYHKM